jgi:hypothetical protein
VQALQQLDMGPTGNTGLLAREDTSSSTLLNLKWWCRGYLWEHPQAPEKGRVRILEA